MSSNPDPRDTPDSVRTRPHLASAANNVRRTIAQQEEDNALRPNAAIAESEHMPTKSDDTSTPHTQNESSNTQQQPVSNGAPFRPDPRFTPIDLSRRLTQIDESEQPSAQLASKNTRQRPLAKDELGDFDNEFEELAPKTRPQRKVSSALRSTNWRVKPEQQNVERPALNAQARVFAPSRRVESPLVILSRLTPYKITKRYRTPKPATENNDPPISYTRSPLSVRDFSAAYAPREMPRPQPSDDYLNQAVDDPVRATAPQRLLIILDLNGTCVHRHQSSKPGSPRPHLKPFLEYLFEYHDVMVWSSAMPKNVNKMCRNIFTPEQFDKLVAMWTRENLRLGRLIVTKIKGHKQLTWVWEALNAIKEDKTWLYDQTNTVLIDDTRLKAAAEPWNLLEVPEWNGHDQDDDILRQARKYIDENLCWTRDVSQYLHKHPPTFSTPATISGGTQKAADSLAEEIATLDLSKE